MRCLLTRWQMIIDSELVAAERLAVAALIGLAVGLEREWSGHASGPDARFAGLRTFLLLGIVGGIGGLLIASGQAPVAAVLVLGAMALSVAAYISTTRRETTTVDGTTEAAAIAVVGLGTIAGFGWIALAAAAGAIMVLALSEKQRLHSLVKHIGAVELQAALQFAVLAVAVLPWLPSGPLLGALAIRPRALWAIVLAFSALNFGGYLARRAFGTRHGYSVAGAIGGMLSSTAVTLSNARSSRVAGAPAAPLAAGVLAACTVLIPRILIVSAVINPPVALAALPLLLPPLAAGVALTVFGQSPRSVAPATPSHGDDRNPLRLMHALEMALAFQLALTLIAWIRPAFGTLGLYGTAAVLGLTDMDALTVSMSAPASQIDASIAARALAIGILANTMFKLTLAVVVGRAGFRRRAGGALAVLALASIVALFVL